MIAATEAEQPLDQAASQALNSDITNILGERPHAAPAAPAAPVEPPSASPDPAAGASPLPVADLLRCE